MARIIIADLKGRGGFVNKDTIAGGYGSRFHGYSTATRIALVLRRVFYNVPSITVGYLASIFARAGHEVVVTRDDKRIEGDLGLVLTSLVDYRHEREWALAARSRGMKVGFFGTPATHLPELFAGYGDFVIQGEPDAAALQIAAGANASGSMISPAINDLDSLPFPRWDLTGTSRFGYSSKDKLGFIRAVPMLTSRSCPEHCTYCPHRITASFRARSVENVIAEMEELAARYHEVHIVIRDPLFTLDRERCFRITEEIRRLKLNLSFECETRMDDLDEELIRAMHAAGLREISFGVENPDPIILKTVARRFISHDHMRNMINLCWELGVATTAFYVIGFLQDTEESIRDTIRFSVELDTTYTNFKILTPYPGTPQFKQLKPLIFETDSQKFDGYTLTFNHPVLTPRRGRLLLGMAFSRSMLRPSQVLNTFGLHKYSHLRWVKKADDWIWRRQDKNDRPWMAEREVAEVI